MAMFDFLSLTKRLSDLGAEIRGLRGDLETKRRERELVAAAPLSKEDALQAMHRRIDELGAAHLKTLSAALHQVALRGDPERVFNIPILATVKPDVSPGPLTLEYGICLAFGDQMKAAASRIIESMPWPDGALDNRTRADKLAKLDSQIISIEGELSALVKSARAAGISV